MRKLLFLLLLALLPAFAQAQRHRHQTKREYYQIKIYSLKSEAEIAVTEQYLENALLPALHRQGLNRVGVFKKRDAEADSVKLLYVLIPAPTLERFGQLETALLADTAYLRTGNAYLNAPFDHIPYERIQTILLQAFPDMPALRPSALDGPRADRVYELRSYESATEALHRNKVDMFNAGGEVKLFERLKFNAVFYGSVLSGPRMPNLMYMTTFSDRDSRERHWSEFVAAPEWKELIAMPKYQHNVSHIDIVFLAPTAYSDY